MLSIKVAFIIATSLLNSLNVCVKASSIIQKVASKCYFRYITSPQIGCCYVLKQLPQTRAENFRGVLDIGYTIQKSESRPQHAFHVGYLNLKFNATTKQYDAEARFFTDDLELAIGQSIGKKTFRLGGDDNSDALLKSYILENIALKNGQKIAQPIASTFVTEQLSEITKIFFSISAAAVGHPERGIAIKCSVITNTYPDHVNIINLKYNTDNQGLTIKSGEIFKEFNIN